MHRRDFLAQSAALSLLPLLLRRRTNLAIGFQSWVVRTDLAADFAGTLVKMAAMGYEAIEMCSPVGYRNYGFGPLAEHSATDMKSIITDAGLSCDSSHYTAPELREDLRARIDFAKELGLNQMVVASPGIGSDASLDDWKRAIDEINGWGRAVTESGLTFAYHNHNFEFDKVEEQLIYDLLLSGLDPSVVKMQFQVWVVSIGYKAADYFRANPERFVSAHLADWTGSGEERAPVGGGVVDWSDFFEAGTGLKNCFVEMAPEFLPDSAKFLHGLRSL